MVKGETVMPVPGGEITTTELWQQPVEQELPEVVEEVVEEVEDDLPELS
jgi:hypothetical protein